MPLLSGGLTVVTPEEIETGPSIAYQETVGIPSFSWIDPDGREWPLSNTREDLGWFTIMGPSGWGAAPIEMATDDLPRGGVAVRYIQDKASTIQWPLEIFGSNHDEFVARYRRISRAFTLTTRRHKPGLLRVARPNGQVREAECYYSAGLEAEGEQNHLYARPVISLFCPEGKWRSNTPVVAVRTFTPTTDAPDDPENPGDPGGGTGTPVTFFSPYLSLTSSRVVGSGTGAPPAETEVGVTEDPSSGDDSGSLTTITNSGDVEAWPTWTITGPMSVMRAWNVTLGTRFALNFTLSPQQTITITTDRPTVRGPGDANLSRHIDWFNPAGTELWPLADGTNVIGLEVDGASAGTSVKMAFTPRFDNS
jgi:hypothetical protein